MALPQPPSKAGEPSRLPKAVLLLEDEGLSDDAADPADADGADRDAADGADDAGRDEFAAKSTTRSDAKPLYPLNPAIFEHLFAAAKQNPAMSLGPDGKAAAGWLVSMFVSEALRRASKIAEAEAADQVTGSHLERVLPQLLLDFS